MTGTPLGPNVVRCGGRGWDCNQFLVKDPATNAFDMVDAGHGLDFGQVLREVAAVTDPKRVRSVTVTHEHLDHTNGLPRWRELGARLLAPRPVARKLHEGRDPTSEMFGGRIPTLDVDEELLGGDRVRLGDRDFEVLATPGHCPGATCYWDAQSGTLFSGDTLFDAGGIGRFDFPDSDLARLHESIRGLAKLPVRALHPGHGDGPTGDAAARSVAASLRHVEMCVRET